MTRQYTNQLLEMIEEGIMDAETVLRSCLSYMSEADVKDMAEREGFIETWQNARVLLKLKKRMKKRNKN